MPVTGQVDPGQQQRRLLDGGFEVALVEDVVHERAELHRARAVDD